ncbi:MAG: molybdopterin-dependent oxidoreductase [Rhodovibrio sp.]|nr:molybdopterin-dependent oxidoreductase [Rhodovibrio sp.]
MPSSSKFAIGRRGFLAGSTAFGGALVAGANRFARAGTFGFGSDTAGMVPGSGKWLPTVCQGCTSWCVKQAYVQDGRVQRIRGHEKSKIYGTSGCVRQNMALTQLYDPDRVRYPMKRTNPKKGRGEDPGFVRISWEEAMDLFAEKVLALRERGEPHKYVTTRGRYGGLNGVMLSAITKIIGSPNNISHSSICAEADKFGPYYLEGFWGYRQYDIKNSRYQLTFGADPVAANRQTSFAAKEWGAMLDHAKVAVVDPRFSSTAQKADEWLPIKPGQDSALALALAHVILVEGLWYKPFVGDFADGRNRFVAGTEVAEADFEQRYSHGLVKWWNLELKDRTPAWAAERTGLPEEQILRVARDLGAAAPRVGVWLSRGMHMTVRGAYASMCGHALTGLLGAADNEGGSMRFNDDPTASLPDGADYRDEIAKAGLQHEKIDRRGRLELPALKEGKSGGGVVTGQLAQSMLEEDPYPVEVMYASWNNFAWANANPLEFEAAFSKLPFMVYSTTNLSETGMFADVVLPAGQAMFERWSVISNAGNGYGTVGFQQPMVKVGDTRQDESEIPWLFAEALARKGFTAPLDYLRNEFADPETGAAPENGDDLGRIMVKMATRPIWDPEQDVGGDTFSGWDEFREVGVWNSDPYDFRGKWGRMGTKTGNFEFYSETLKQALSGHAEKHGVAVDRVLEVCNYEARGERAFIPHYEPPVRFGDEADFPLLLVDAKHKLNREGRGCNHEWYTSERDVEPGDIKFEDAAKFNPVDANRLGIQTGDDIRITSQAGSITCKAGVWEGVRPGCVVKSFGMGHWAYGRHVSKEFGKTPIGGNNNELMPRDFDRLSGSSVFAGQIGVRVEKV